MNMSRIRIGLLCTAAAVLPSLLLAQMGSTPNQPSPNQQQPQPGGAAGSGMAGAMTGTSGANDPAGEMMKDKMFLHKAAEGGMAEVQLGQLAAQKGNSDEVKAFGKKMVDDHTMLNDSMKPIAESMGVHAPTKLNKKDQAEFDKLNGMSGDDFDKEYLAYMVKDHHADVREFREEDASTTDPALKAAVEKGLQVIRQHSMMVDKLAKSKGVVMPGKAGMAPSGL